IDGADALVTAAQHALLKTLEEPPPSSVFILVTSRPDTLLATVLSRCPQLRFRPLAADDIAAALVARGYSESDALAVAATADGSLGQALAARADERVEARDVAQRVLAHAAATAEPGRRIDGAKELLIKTGAGGAGDREQLASHLRAMASLLRDVEVLATRADDRALANPDVRPALERLTGAYHGERGVVQTGGGTAGGTGVRGIPQLDAKRRPPADSPQRVVRLATREDIVARLKHQHREQEAFRIALLKIREHGLGMKLARVEQA